MLRQYLDPLGNKICRIHHRNLLISRIQNHFFFFSDQNWRRYEYFKIPNLPGISGRLVSANAERNLHSKVLLGRCREDAAIFLSALSHAGRSSESSSSHSQMPEDLRDLLSDAVPNSTASSLPSIFLSLAVTADFTHQQPSQTTTKAFTFP